MKKFKRMLAEKVIANLMPGYHLAKNPEKGLKRKKRIAKGELSQVTLEEMIDAAKKEESNGVR